MTIRLTLIYVILGLISFQTTEAQLLKRLKDKAKQVQNKVEQKIDNKVDEKINKTVDGTIDGIFEESSDVRTTDVTNEKEDYNGNLNINHSQNYGSVSINTLNNLKIERTNDGYNFYGSWMSHQVDIFDGYRLEIKTDENLELGKTYTFNIGQNSNLTLGYDPQTPALVEDKSQFKRGVSDDYQDYDLETGFVKVTINSKESFTLDFSGQANLSKRTRDASDNVNESKYMSSIMGELNGTNPKFLEARTNSSKESTTRSSETTSFPKSSRNMAVSKDSYAFTIETIIEMSVPDQKEKYKISYLLNPNEDYVGMKMNMSDFDAGDVGGETIIVIDNNDSFVFVDTPGMKMQMSSSQMGGNQMANPTEQIANYEYTNVQKTGNTKTILGYNCEEYMMTDNANTIRYWVAPEADIPNWFVKNKSIMNGHIMEYEVDSKDGKMKIKTIEINKNVNIKINPSEYRKMF